MEKKYYKRLIESAKRKKKSEMEIYKNVYECIEDIIKENPEYNEASLLKILIAYFEGDNYNVTFSMLIQIACGILVGVVSCLNAVGVGKSDIKFVITIILFLAIIFALMAYRSKDFEKKFVICVLNDRLYEYNNTQCMVDVNIGANVQNDRKSKKRKNKNRKCKS